jgi:hypothetical protein
VNAFEKHKAEAYRQHEAKTRDDSQQKWNDLEKCLFFGEISVKSADFTDVPQSAPTNDHKEVFR